MIKPVSYEDLDKCARVIRESFSTVADDFGLTEQNCSTNGAFIKSDKLKTSLDNGCLMYGLYSGEVLSGFVLLEKKDDSSYILEKLAVLPSCRHRGFGRELISFCRDTVKELGGSKILISIIEENVRLRKWYEDCGFIHTGTKKFDHLPFTVGFMETSI